MSEIINDYSDVGRGVWDFFNVARKREIWFYETVLAILRDKIIPQEAVDDYEATLSKLKKLR
jgi:hypothetical protein